jgi:hypothetical protein
MNDQEKLAKLETRLADLEARLPAHSVPASMMIELEELEDEIETLRRRMGREQS